jgi:subtilisin family serine protease
MRSRIRAAGATLAAAVLLGPVALAGPASAAPGADVPAAPWNPSRVTGTTPNAPTTKPVTVTLITGDKVTVAGNDRATIKRGPGRSKVTFAVSRANGHLRVVPSDALSLLRSGRVDPRLFDITTLIEFGYDDRRDNVPLIVTGPAGTARAATAGVSQQRAVPGGTAMRAAKAGIGSVWQGLSASVRGSVPARGAAASKIWLDGLRKPTLKESVPQIGAPAAWSAGLDGAGVKVAVVDTGIDETHPDLAGRVAAAQDFTVDGHTRDLVGHGTHVAATIGSTGAAEGGYKGVAPGVSLLSAKVCVDYGCEESWILAGMQWAAEQGAKVINMSLGGGDTPEQDPVEAAVEQLTAERGTLFVISAGNAGQDESIGSPGSADAALTVGAVTKADELADFSSRGPRVGDAALKPDITAPGVDIVAANSKDGFLGEPGALHLSLSGTSMAAPHVAGSAAILAQQHPTWTPAQLKAALMGSAKPKDDIAIFAQGAGRVDVAKAITQTVVSDPPSVSFGRQIWPHQDDTPDARQVTYRNNGTADVTVNLALTGAPAAVFTLSANTVTVPAGGSASVTLTSDTRADVPDGRHGGHLTATGGGTTVVTPFAVDKEVESYDVTVDRLDRNGEPTGDSIVFLMNQENGQVYDLFSEDPSLRKRAPKGAYSVITWIYSGTEEAPEVSMVTDPTVVIDKALTITMDARAAKPISMTVPKEDAASVVALVDTVFTDEDEEWSVGFGLIGDSFDGLFIGQPDPRERLDMMASGVSAQLMKGPLPEEGPLPPSPYAYFLGYTEQDHLPTGYTKRVGDRDLATVQTAFATQGVPTGNTSAFVDLGTGFAISAGMPVSLPGSRTDYFSAQPGTSWEKDLAEVDGENWLNRQSSPQLTYQAGRTYHERRNAAAFGPGFSRFGDLGRYQDQIGIFPALHSPGGQPGWYGFDGTATGRTVLERDGQVVFDQPVVGGVVPGMPAGEAAYKIRVEANRGAPNTLSTNVTAEWTFRSAGVADEEFRPFPASAVRFAPPVDQRNTAPAGKVWLVPVEVQRQPNSTAGRARTLTVEVSYDDGATWKKVPVVRAGQQGVVFVHHPNKAGFVSFRAASTDTAGNTVKQTVIRAYAIS